MSIYTEMGKLGQHIGIPIFNTIAPDNIKDKNYLIYSASSHQGNFEDNKATTIQYDIYLSYFTSEDMDLVESKLNGLDSVFGFENFNYKRSEMTIYVDEIKKFQTVYVLSVYIQK